MRRHQNVFADDLEGRRPQFAELRQIAPFLGQIAGKGDVVDEGIEPHIGHEIRVEGQGNTPRETLLRAGNAQIRPLRALNGLQKVPAAELRLHAVGVGGHELAQPSHMGTEVEVPVFLLQLNDFAPLLAELTLFVALLVGQELLLAHGIKALVGLFVQATLIPQVAEDFLHTSLVPRVRGSGPTVIGYAQSLPEVDETLRHLVGVFLRGDALRIRLLLYLLAVLVHTGQQIRLLPAHSVPTCQHVCQHLLVGVSDVGFSVRVIDCCCDVEHSDVILALFGPAGKAKLCPRGN